MSVFKIMTSSFRFSSRILFQFLCRLIQTREGLGEYEIVTQARDASGGFAKLLRILPTPQGIRRSYVSTEKVL